MRYAILFILSIFFGYKSTYSQNLSIDTLEAAKKKTELQNRLLGIWHSDDYDEVINGFFWQELIIKKSQKQEYPEYGYGFLFKENGTFSNSWNEACASERAVGLGIKGNYEIVDPDYLRFRVTYFDYLEKVEKTTDPVTYFISPVKGGLLLIKTSGNIQSDKKNVFYRSLINQKIEEVSYFESFLDWTSVVGNTEVQLITEYLHKNGIQDFKLLFSSADHKSHLILVDSQYKFLLATSSTAEKKNNDSIYTSLAIYNDTNLIAIDQDVCNINKKPLKSQTIIDSIDNPYSITNFKMTLFTNGEVLEKVELVANSMFKPPSIAYFYFKQQKLIFLRKEFQKGNVNFYENDNISFYVENYPTKYPIIKKSNNTSNYNTDVCFDCSYHQLKEMIKKHAPNYKFWNEE